MNFKHDTILRNSTFFFSKVEKFDQNKTGKNLSEPWNVIFFRYLLDHGANVSAVNNDGELAIDISESDEMEELLQKEIDAHGVDCEASRHSEERLM